MTSYRSLFLQEISRRGFIYQGTDLESLDQRLCQGPVTAYVGFDVTAPSLHVGSMMVIMLLRWLQETGHRPIVLMGGGTTKVGDPSGKDAARQLLSEAQIQENMVSLAQVFAQLLHFGDGAVAAKIVDNDTWLKGLNYIDFLRDFGSHFSVNRMLTFESIRARLERDQHLSFLEFNYPLLQAYDFLHLFETQNCLLQLGGSDQWGNIISGVDLVRRLKSRETFGLTCPLITTATGAKMGKTAQGAVWLNAQMCSPYDYWQFWRNVHDGDVIRFLKFFTLLPLSQIEAFEGIQGAELNEVKKILADEATKLLHGPEALAQVHQTTASLFEGQQGTTTYILESQITVWEVTSQQIDQGLSVLEGLEETGLIISKGEGRRLIRGGGVRVNDMPIQAELHPIVALDFSAEGTLKLSIGRKHHAIVKIKKEV